MKNVLSLSGGGIRGIIQAVILAEIESITGKRVSDLFDLVVGTSTGGILAAALTSPKGYSAKDLIDMYRNDGKTIFSRSPWKALTSVGGLADEKYNYRGLIQVLRKYHANNNLHQSTIPTMLTAYNITKQDGMFLKSWETPGVDVEKACRCTSAAPTYFEPTEYRGDAVIDGGIGVNNPSVSAYVEAKRLFPGEELSVLSIGTGSITRPVSHKEAAEWGAIEWVVPLISAMFNAQEKAADYQMRQLSDNYLYLQTPLTDASDDIDDASAGNLNNLVITAKRILHDNSFAIEQHLERMGCQ